MAQVGPIGGGVVSVGRDRPAIITTKTPHGLNDGDWVGIEDSIDSGRPIYGYAKHAELKGTEFALYSDRGLPVQLSNFTVTETSTVFRPAAEDYAVIVGIGTYSHIPSLRGPVKDASDFEKWLLSSAGGCVPPRNINPVCSPEYPPPAANVDARPTSDMVDQAFIDLAKKAHPRSDYRIGRRLYIFMAGHGIAPAFDVNRITGTNTTLSDLRARGLSVANETALLMANYEPAAPGLHIGGRIYAEWFREAGVFDEVVLLVDCCRDEVGIVTRSHPFAEPQWKRPSARRFYAMATKLASKAWESNFNGEVRGIFSYSVMAALRNRALGNDNGELTGQILASHLYSLVPKLMQDQEPTIEYDDKDDIVFVKRPLAGRMKARIRFAPRYIGKTAFLLGRKYPDPDDVHVIAAADPWIVTLERFHYMVKVDGTAQPPQSFEVDGTREIIDVSIN